MDTLEADQKFERYRIIRQLGQGIAGISYAAEDSKLKDTVVLKLINPWSGLPYAARRQFFRDMQVLSVLRQAGLAAVLNYGEVNGQIYVVRQYISNGSLLGNAGRIWFNPPLAISDAFTYAYQIAQVLHLFHNYGYAHGALTFSNILLAEQPQAGTGSAPLLLSDAGLAQFVRRFGKPQQGLLPMTAAPEQFKGQTTPASDQYALAILLSVWLTGRPPFAGTPTEIEQLKRNGVIPALQAGLTQDQEAIIRRALDAEQEARYPSIMAFAEALSTSLQSAPAPKAGAQTTDRRQTTPDQQPAKQAIQHIASALAEEKPAPLTPRIEPDVPQPRPAPQRLPEPVPEVQPVPPAPAPEVEPVVIPTPAPDIAQPIPEQTPFPPAPEPLQPQPSPDREVKTPSQEIQSHYTEPLPDPATLAIAPHASLLITSPFWHETRKFPLLKDEVTIGRAGSSDILLDEDTLTSRHHAHIKREGEQYSIFDKRSTHGVTVNDQKLEEDRGHLLKEGDRIQIGDYRLLFSFSLAEDTDKAHIEHALL